MSDSALQLDDILARQGGDSEAVVNVDEPELKLVIFSLGKDCFAFDGQYIREILVDTPLHFIPGCSPALAGVINVRGDIESVLALDTVLQLPAIAEHQTTPTILLAHNAELRTGIAIERVIDVIDLPHSALHSPPGNFAEPLRSLVSAVFEFNAQPVSLLDFNQLIAGWLRSLD